MAQKKYRNRLQLKITVYFILLAILLINSVGWFLYYRAKHYFDVELGKKLVGISQSSADFMDAELLTYLKPGDEEGTFYQSLLHTLNILKNDFHVTRIYIIDKYFKVLVDTRPNSAIGSIIPHLQSNLVELNMALDGKAVYSILYRGYNGNLYKSAFFPVENRAGKVVAIACVDASPGFLQVIDKIRGSILFINLISFVFAILLAIFLARSIVNPIKRLVNAALRVSRGDFSRSVELSTKNEIGFLGQVFNDMQKNIKINEGKLRKLKQLAEAEAASIKNYNDYILQSIANGILTLDLDGNITVLNPEAARILRLNSSKSVGKNCQAIFTADHPLYPFLKQSHKKIPKSDFMEKTLNFGDSPITVGIQISPLLDSEQHIIGSNWVFTDLTELRKLQEKIKAKERMAYLGELSAAVAHEIRNPLNSIELYIGLMKRQLSSKPELIQAIDKIQQEIQALNSIVTDFLIFARPPQLNYQSVILSDLLQETLMLAENEIRQKNIHVQMNFSDNTIIIKGDYNQLKQALLNVILNAVQSMQPGGVLSIKASHVQGKGRPVRVRIQVNDTGKGIPEKNIEKIFEPFYSTRNQGTGLGLSIVHNIIRAHSGAIFVESEADKGTTVTFELPKEMEK
ncbi:MAG: HAMP domain-containing protein [Actinobacteria bacterium]|nr:HAMP domain-containing protein [Actinomycetota bacterium]